MPKQLPIIIFVVNRLLYALEICILLCYSTKMQFMFHIHYNGHQRTSWSICNTIAFVPNHPPPANPFHFLTLVVYFSVSPASLVNRISVNWSIIFGHLLHYLCHPISIYRTPRVAWKSVCSLFTFKNCFLRKQSKIIASIVIYL